MIVETTSGSFRLDGLGPQRILLTTDQLVTMTIAYFNLPERIGTRYVVSDKLTGQVFLQSALLNRYATYQVLSEQPVDG